MSVDDRSVNALSRDVIGAAIEVHRELGPGLLESAYADCLQEAVREAGLGVSQEVEVPARFRGRRLDARYRIDLLVEDALVVEVKACEEVKGVHKAQLLTYLQMTDASVGLLINFSVPKLVDGVTRLIA
jgi:GxxExxY protein